MTLTRKPRGVVEVMGSPKRGSDAPTTPNANANADVSAKSSAKPEPRNPVGAEIQHTADRYMSVMAETSSPRSAEKEAARKRREEEKAVASKASGPSRAHTRTFHHARRRQTRTRVTHRPLPPPCAAALPGRGGCA